MTNYNTVFKAVTCFASSDNKNGKRGKKKEEEQILGTCNKKMGARPSWGFWGHSMVTHPVGIHPLPVTCPHKWR